MYYIILLLLFMYIIAFIYTKLTIPGLTLDPEIRVVNFKQKTT
jgi:hypothetical protein